MTTPTPTTAPADQPFTLRAPTAFWWTVRVPVPTDNDYTVYTLRCLFKPVAQPTLDLWRGMRPAAEGEKVPTEAEICHQVLKDWQGPLDTEGAPLPFSPEALDKALRIPMAGASIVATYLAAMSGTAARKNA